MPDPIKLVPLEQFNEERSRRFLAKEPLGNGLACPRCGGELLDLKNTILPVTPPRMPVFCPKCNHRDSRVI